MITMKHDEIINSHRVECQGVNRNNRKAFIRAENVIVKIYKSGRSEPLCRYFKLVSDFHVCNPMNIKSDDIMEFGDCPFYTS